MLRALSPTASLGGTNDRRDESESKFLNVGWRRLEQSLDAGERRRPLLGLRRRVFHEGDRADAERAGKAFERFECWNA